MISEFKREFEDLEGVPLKQKRSLARLYGELDDSWRLLSSSSSRTASV
jgi:hypothetical protein